MNTDSYSVRQVRTVILAALLILAAICWVLIFRHAAMPGMPGMNGLTLGMDAPLFLAMWVVMMVAMMFPAAAPMILMFARVHADKRRRGQPFVPGWIFVGAYLLVWALSGVVFYALAVAAEALAQQSNWLMQHAARIGGALFILAGLYQLSPLKQACLAKCQTPLDFILGAWREGYGGALRMGMAHGLYCLGCCWLLFIILFPLGLMNIAAMLAITLLIVAEKFLPAQWRIAQIAAVILMAYGLLIIIVPEALPTTLA